jgi:Cu/Ag efflux protein CusF
MQHMLSVIASRPMAFTFTLTTKMESDMKTIFLAVSVALSMSVFPTLAADEHATHGDGDKAQASTKAIHAGHGKVISVDEHAGTVKLSHDPIKSLNWPKMTMDFKAHDPAMLKDLKPGTQVDFELMKKGNNYHVTKISPTAN